MDIACSKHWRPCVAWYCAIMILLPIALSLISQTYSRLTPWSRNSGDLFNAHRATSHSDVHPNPLSYQPLTASSRKKALAVIAAKASAAGWHGRQLEFGESRKSACRAPMTDSGSLKSGVCRSQTRRNATLCKPSCMDGI